MEHFPIDAYTPKEIAARVENASVSKSHTDPIRVFVLAILAGAFIAFGAAFFTVVTQQAEGIHPGVLRLLGGLVFSLGLVLVVVAGAELFTGNNLLVIACVDKKITPRQLLKNWLIVFIGNFVGALFIVMLIYASHHWMMNQGAVGLRALTIANAKVNLGFWQAFTSGILCNLLVCLAVWLCFAGHSVTDKILAILFPITAFVTLGFEHSVANMYFIPAGLAILEDPELLAQIQNSVTSLDLSNLTVTHFLVKNLLPVTLGNMFGGSCLVGLVYWFIYVRE